MAGTHEEAGRFHARAAIDGFVRSFSLRDRKLYTDRSMASEAGVEVTPKSVILVRLRTHNSLAVSDWGQQVQH